MIGALLRRLGLHRRRPEQPQPGLRRLREGRADGRRPDAAPAATAPTFMVYALRDPIGANLDRIQIVKGWLDAAARRTRRSTTSPGPATAAGADGKLPPVGNTVDVANATWTNTIGAPELARVWTDPDFDPEQRRSTTRASSRSRRRAGRLRRLPLRRRDARGRTSSTQERAYTSPIWYTPANAQSSGKKRRRKK